MIAVSDRFAIEVERRLDQRAGAIGLTCPHIEVRAQRARRISHPDAAAVPPFLERGVHERFGIGSAGIRLELREQVFTADNIGPCPNGVARAGHRGREVTAAQGQSSLRPDDALASPQDRPV